MSSSVKAVTDFAEDNDNIFTVLDDYTDSLFNTNINMYIVQELVLF